MKAPAGSLGHLKIPTTTSTTPKTSLRPHMSRHLNAAVIATNNNGSIAASMHPTLDIEHSHYLKRHAHATSRASQLTQELSALRRQSEDLRSNLDDPNSLQVYLQICDKIRDANSELSSLNKNFDIVDYYTNTASILFNYYDILEKGDSQTAGQTSASGGGRLGGASKSILSYFETSAGSKPAREDAGGDNKRPTHDRATLLDKYRQSVDDMYMKPMSSVMEHSACHHCGSSDITVVIHDGYCYCNQCNTMEYMLVDHDKPSYKDPPKEITYFAYKRINHFNEWLNQVQGKETTEIPDEIYDKILLEIKQQKIGNMAQLTYQKIKDILKKLKINKYYEHIPHIINRLNGLPTPHLPPDLEDRLRHMFCQIQVPFLKFSPSTRKNFLSYSYVLHKFMQLLEKDQYLVSFPLLKSREKLQQQDQIWSKICNELGWQFIRSV